jgi:hypothetical protein
MFRTFLASLVVASVTMSAQAAITVDGDIGDWVTAGLLKTDPSNDNGPPRAVEMLRYGMTVEGGTFYAVAEINRPVNDFNGYFGSSARKIYTSVFINADRSTSTTLLNTPDSWVDGTDINLEVDRYPSSGSGDPVTSGVYFWGLGGDLGNFSSQVGVFADSGDAALGVIEFSCSVSSIQAALATTNGATPGNIWDCRMEIQGTTRDSSDPKGYNYGNDLSKLVGDANLDNTADVADLTNLLNNYNKTGMAWANGDFDGDGTVNVADLTALLNNYNKTNNVNVSGGVASLQAAVPEPSSIVLLATLSGLLGAWVIRRRS